MKKVVFVVGLIGAAGILYFVFNINRVVKAGIEDVGPTITQTEVQVGKVALSFLSGQGELRNFKIANPEGFTSENAFVLDYAKLDVDPKSLMSDMIVVEEFSVDGAHLTLEQHGTQVNLRVLQEHLEEYIGTAENDSTASTTKMVIDKFSFTNAKATLIFDFSDDKVVTIPDIHLSDIGRSDAGSTVAAAILEVMAPIIEETVETSVKEGFQLRDARGILDRINPFKKRD